MKDSVYGFEFENPKAMYKHAAIDDDGEVYVFTRKPIVSYTGIWVAMPIDDEKTLYIGFLDHAAMADIDCLKSLLYRLDDGSWVPVKTGV
jgi:hypothetical protein